MDLATPEALMLVKWIIGGFLMLCTALVIGAAIADIRERRRWRAMVPDCWPPAGVLHEEERAKGVLS